MAAMAFNYKHRKQKKRDFKRLWMTRISAAAKIQGISYSKLIDGLNRAGCLINRKMLADLALHDPLCFNAVATKAKHALIAI
jgi:large subunit ribosomal protein L20